MRRLRSRSCQVLTLLLGIAGLAALGVESVSFGHEHATGGHAHRHHSHFYFGPHEHHADDHDHDDHDDHDGEQPDHHHDHAPRRGATTVAATPALFQPASAVVPVLPPAVWTSGVLPSVPRLAAQHAHRQSSPRAPPSGL